MLVQCLGQVPPVIVAKQWDPAGVEQLERHAALESEIVAFTDANAVWAPDALRALVRSFADPDVGYVCGHLDLQRADGTSREGVYWRYELWVRESESRLAGITAGNGAIYAVRREDYRESDPRMGHDLGFPYTLAQNGRRSVY